MNLLNKGKILITGGAGFIGSALIWALNQQGITEILVSDFLGADEKWKNLSSLSFDDYIEADSFLNQLRQDPSLFNEIKTVFHLGACSSTTEKDVRYLIQNNYEYTKELASWAIQRDTRFIYASSAATYGDGATGMNDDETQLENLQPLNPYGYSKHLFDLYAKRHGLLDRIVGLKYFNVFGPNESHKGDMRSMVHKAFQQIQQQGVVRLFKSNHPDYRHGEQKRDFLYVKDAVNMTLHLAITEIANGLFNIGSGKAQTWLDLAHAVFKALNRPEKIEFIDMPVAIQSKYQNFTQADISKLRNTGYQTPVTSLNEAVHDYITNYLLPDKQLRT